MTKREMADFATLALGPEAMEALRGCIRGEPMCFIKLQAALPQKLVPPVLEALGFSRNYRRVWERTTRLPLEDGMAIVYGLLINLPYARKYLQANIAIALEAQKSACTEE